VAPSWSTAIGVDVAGAPCLALAEGHVFSLLAAFCRFFVQRFAFAAFLLAFSAFDFAFAFAFDDNGYSMTFDCVKSHNSLDSSVASRIPYKGHSCKVSWPTTGTLGLSRQPIEAAASHQTKSAPEATIIMKQHICTPKQGGYHLQELHAKGCEFVVCPAVTAKLRDHELQHGVHRVERPLAQVQDLCHHD
jgi:hypothetical protein